jgi:hypothetical protein
MRVMATYKYRYTGKDPVHLPLHGVNAKHGEEIEVDLPIKHPDFERIDTEPKKKEEHANK